jgi:hypothetical protein
MFNSRLPLSRRQMIAGATAAAAAAPLATSVSVGQAHAKAEMKEVDRPTHRRFKLGDFSITTINDGAISLDNPQAIFGTNASKEDFEAQARQISCRPTGCRSASRRSSSIPVRNWFCSTPATATPVCRLQATSSITPSRLQATALTRSTRW